MIFRLRARYLSMSARCALAFLLFGVGLIVSPGAWAHSQATNNCNDDTLNWKFTTSSLWTTSKKTWVREAINKLNNALDYDGTTLVTPTESSSGNIEVDIRDEPIGQLGESGCTGVFAPFIWVNSNYSSASFYYKVGRHEMLHLAGGEHGGEKDSFDGVSVATMSTCLSPSIFPTENKLEQDSQAYENWLWSSLSTFQLNANIGFEQGFNFWGKDAGAGTSVERSSGGATGPGFIAWTSNSLNPNIYQTDKTGEWKRELQLPGEDQCEVAIERLHYSGNAGRLYYRTVNFPNMPSSPNNCSYPDGVVNPNGAPSLGGWILGDGTQIETVGPPGPPSTANGSIRPARRVTTYKSDLAGRRFISPRVRRVRCTSTTSGVRPNDESRCGARSNSRCFNCVLWERRGGRYGFSIRGC